MPEIEENMYVDRLEGGCGHFEACAVNECPLNLATKRYNRQAAEGDPERRCKMPLEERQRIIGTMTAAHRELLLHDNGMQAWEYALGEEGLKEYHAKARMYWDKVKAEKAPKGPEMAPIAPIAPILTPP